MSVFDRIPCLQGRVTLVLPMRFACMVGWMAQSPAELAATYENIGAIAIGNWLHQYLAAAESRGYVRGLREAREALTDALCAFRWLKETLSGPDTARYPWDVQMRLHSEIHTLTELTARLKEAER